MKLVRIRQDLEKSRNLTYMIQKREQLKRQQLNVEREMSTAELAFASATPLPNPSAMLSQRYLDLYLVIIYLHLSAGRRVGDARESEILYNLQLKNRSLIMTWRLLVYHHPSCRKYLLETKAYLLDPVEL